MLHSYLRRVTGRLPTSALLLPAIAGNYGSTPALVYPTTEIEYEMRLRPTDWAPAGNQIVVGRDDGSTNRIARIILVAAGTMQLQLSVNGTALTGSASSNLPFRFGWGTVKVTWRASDGRVQWFTSPDGNQFTQLGADGTIAIASIFAGNNATEIGSVLSGASTLYSGQIGYVRIRSTIGGANFLNFDPSRYVSGNSFVAESGETWTINRTGLQPARIVRAA